MLDFKIMVVSLRLLKAKKAENKNLCSQLVAQCAKVLNGRQRAALPEDIKELVMKKYEQIQEKKKL